MYTDVHSCYDAISHVLITKKKIPSNNDFMTVTSLIAGMSTLAAL